MFDFDINKVHCKQHISYNNFEDGACFGNLFTNVDNSDSKRGVSWLDYNASVTATMQKLVYWFKTRNNVRAKYLLIHSKLKEYIDKYNIDLKYNSFTLNTKLLIDVNDTIPCNKVVIVGEDNKTCAFITVFDEEDIDKLG